MHNNISECGVMRSRRKTITRITSDTCPELQNGTPLKQTTIMECFKVIKTRKPKLERFNVSRTVIEIDSDSDMDIPSKPAFNIKCEKKDEPANSVTENNNLDAPSPPKKPRMMQVHRPSTSTPVKAPDTLIWRMPQISKVESLNTGSPGAQSLITDSPNNVASDSTNRTIHYQYTGQTSQGSTVLYSPGNTPKSAAKINVHEVLVLNDPNNFADTTSQNAMDSFPTTSQFRAINRKLTSSARSENIPATKHSTDLKRKSSNGREESSSTNKENSKKLNIETERSCSSLSTTSRTKVAVGITRSTSISITPNGSTIIATPNQTNCDRSDEVQKSKKEKKKSKKIEAVVKKISNLKTGNADQINSQSPLANNRKITETPKETVQNPQNARSDFENPTPGSAKTPTTPIKTINDGQTPSCSKSLGVNVKQGALSTKPSNTVETPKSSVVNKQTPSTSKPPNDQEKSANKQTTTPTRNSWITAKKLVSSDIGSPRKSSNVSPFKANPRQCKSWEVKTLKAKEGKQLQTKQLKELVDLFGGVVANRNLRNLLSPFEHSVLKRFEAMNGDVKYLVMKLFVWKRTWYNIHKFCQTAQIQTGNQKDIVRIFEFLKNENYVDTDYKKSAAMIDMLQELDRQMLREVMDELRIRPIAQQVQNKDESVQKTSTKQKNGSTFTKHELIGSILIATSTQATLTKKSLQDMVMDQIEKKLGFAIRIKEDVYDALHHAYVLATFTNSEFDTIQDYFKNIIHFSVVFPATSIEERIVFYSQEKFLSYVHASKIRKRLDSINKNQNKFEVYNIGSEAYEYLKNLQRPAPNDPNQEHADALHLKRFTAEYVYCAILTTCCEHIYTKQNGKPDEVLKWLELMIEKYPQSKRQGKWYLRLINLHMRHLEPISYKAGAKILINVLNTKKDVLGERALFELGSIGLKLQLSKSHRLDQIYHDRLAELMPEMINPLSFPQLQIDSQCIRSNKSGKKRVYITRGNDEASLSYVEVVALNHYAENGYPAGDNGEGALIKALFLLYFWDIIYNPEKTVPGTFISKLQSAPLDMFTPRFYENRKEAIRARLYEIDSKWPEDQLIEFGANNWQAHSHETTAFGMVINAVKDPVSIEVLMTVIGRKILANIFNRLCKNIAEFSSGMPDLLVWNADQKIHKFVEVKGEGDNLRPNQILWLNYLKKIGASIEVCWVHSAGSKRKKINKLPEGENVEKRAASPSNNDDD